MNALLAWVDGTVLWGLCVAFYTFDAAVLIGRDQTIVTRTRKGIVSLNTDYPFEFCRKLLYFPGFGRPARAFFIGATPEAIGNRKRALEATRLARIDRALWLVKYVSVVAFLNLFLYAPILTRLFGLERALRTIVLNHLVLAVIASACVLSLKPLFQATLTKRLETCAEILLFPPNLPNTLKRCTRWVEVRIADLAIAPPGPADGDTPDKT